MAVSAQQAAMNALYTYLNGKISGVSVYRQWPSADITLTKAISIIRTGGRKDDFVQPEIIAKLSDNGNNSTYRWRVAYCTQGIQLDVWTTSQLDRDDVIAQLDTLLHAGDSAAGIINAIPVDNHILLNLNAADDWTGTVQAMFEEFDVTDNPDTVQQDEYRATAMGTLYFELTVDATSPRLAQIILSQKLHNEETAPSDMTYDNTIIS